MFEMRSFPIDVGCRFDSARAEARLEFGATAGEGWAKVLGFARATNLERVCSGLERVKGWDILLGRFLGTCLLWRCRWREARAGLGFTFIGQFF